MDVPVLHSTNHSDCILVTPRPSGTYEASRYGLFLGTNGGTTASITATAYMQLHSSTSAQSFSWTPGIALFQWWILRGYDDIVSQESDHFTAWVNLNPHEVLAQHMVDIHRAAADFREASERRPATSSQTHGANKHLSTQSLVQKRLSIYSWNPGPRRGKEDAFEKQIAGRWHVITLQEASEYVDHGILLGRFHVTHDAGCAILFNKDTFYPNIDVMSIYFHDTRRDLPDQVVEGEKGWFLQGVLSRASLRRAAASDQKFFSLSSQHISNIYAKRKGIAKNLILTLRAIMSSLEVDLVAGDFNGTAWRCGSRDNLSTVDEAFTDCALPAPPGLPPLWRPGSIPANWADISGFLKPSGSVNKHGAFSIPCNTKHGFISRLEQYLVQKRRIWTAHFCQRTTCRLLMRKGAY